MSKKILEAYCEFLQVYKSYKKTWECEIMVLRFWKNNATNFDSEY